MGRFQGILWIVVFIAGFILGVAWKAQNTDTTEKKVPEQVVDVSPRQVSPVRIISNTEEATIALFEEAAPSVVFVTSIDIRRDYWTRNVTEIPSGTGSGFIWDNAGHIVTNYHVIRQGKRFRITLSDGSDWDARIAGYAPEKDLAVLKIDAPDSLLTPIPIGTSNDLRVGQSVFAIGNPFGLDQSLTTGVISAVGREITSLAQIPIRDVIQTDAAINPGNSGGPLLDSSGRLIGVNTQIYSTSGSSAGIGFAIPVDEVNWVVPDLIRYGEVKRPVLGVTLARQGSVTRLQLEGALILDIAEGSAAERAGLRPTSRNLTGGIALGDLIVGVNAKPIKSGSDLILELEKFAPGDLITLTVEREGKEIEIPLTLDEPGANPFKR